MELNVLLFRVIGLLLVIGSLAAMLRWKYYAGVVEEFVQARPLRMMMSLVELVAGLVIVNLLNDWSTLANAIVSAVGWLAIIEATLYLFISDTAFAKLVRSFNSPGWYFGGGSVSLLAGAYLALVGYGLIG